ncbi:MAG: radical SAM/SPASM domain-containing protein [Bradymonadia bacterium]
MKLRYEDFGAIIALDDPPALVHVDQTMARALGGREHPSWSAPSGHLSAPIEVHLMTTNRCPAACPGCYTGATPSGAEPTVSALKAVVDQLADAGVFHVALGGGESMLRPGLFELAHYIRQRGMVPNLTTSGIGLTPERARACTVFGRVNVSMDGVGAVYRQSRGYDGAAAALKALSMLAEAGVRCGINCVLSRATFEALPQTVEAVVAYGVDEVECLRFKPTGRGRDIYESMALTEAQSRSLTPTLMALAEQYPAVSFKVDCSFIPMLCAANPDPEQLERFGVYGCEAGHALSAITAELHATPCSFIETPLGDAGALGPRWGTDETLKRWRSYPENAPAPCNTCVYRSICKGGCKAVTAFYDDTYFAPDPECPRVMAHHRGVPFEPVRCP